MEDQARALRFSYDRLQSLLRTLRITDMDEFTPIQQCTTFATLLATYDKGQSGPRFSPPLS
jgi:DNA excision repair protein ERCC-2